MAARHSASVIGMPSASGGMNARMKIASNGFVYEQASHVTRTRSDSDKAGQPAP
jgi:hypothetical protein